MDGFETNNDYEEPENYRRSRKHKRKRYGSSGGRLPLLEDSNEESEECTCSCNSCANIKPCCKDACNCNTQSQPNVVIMPYLYPLVVTQKVVTQTTSTTTTTTTTPKPIRVQETNIHLDNRRISRRRTKPVWLPKYGIVPLPDHLAERLMSKLREVKGLKAERRKR
ncbi:uncharacterized protein LOC119193316 [Manduca sexta]|nr:uncharacterized protein LOC119193316 [Manduca sexta]